MSVTVSQPSADVERRSGIRVEYEDWSVADAKASGREAWAEMTPEERHKSEIQARRIRLHMRSIDLYGRVRARMRLTWRSSRSVRSARRARRVRVARVAKLDSGGSGSCDGPPGPPRPAPLFVERNQRCMVRP